MSLQNGEYLRKKTDKRKVKDNASLYKFGSSLFISLASFLCLMAYQTLWVIQWQSNLSRKTLFVLFNLFLENKRVHAFPMSISPKVNVMVQLKFTLTNHDGSVQHFWHYVLGTLSLLIFEDRKKTQKGC